MENGLLIATVVLSSLSFITSAACLTVVLIGGKKAQVTLKEAVDEVQSKSDKVAKETAQFVANIADVFKS